MQEETRIKTRWDQKIFWRIVWRLGWFIKPFKNLYINKIRADPDYAKDMEEFDA
jgi:hypothetical protein